MTTSRRVPLAQPPGLPAAITKLLLREALDLVLVLDAQDRVINECHAPDVSPALAASLLQRGLDEILSVESRGKLPSILRSNSLVVDSVYRWRHVNLLADGGRTLPVLVKYIELEDDRTVYRALLCRDLSSVDGVNRRLLQVQTEHDREIRRYQEEVTQLARKPWVELVGRLPLHEIRGIVEHWIERDCIQRAMAECANDTRAAALLLGVGIEELEARLRRDMV